MPLPPRSHLGRSLLHHLYPARYTWHAFDVRIGELPEGDLLRIGVCFPLNSTISIFGTPEPQEVDSMEELMEDSSGTGFYVDREVGVVFRRFKGEENSERGIQIVVTDLASEDVDCTQRAYPKYQTPTI